MKDVFRSFNSDLTINYLSTDIIHLVQLIQKCKNLNLQGLFFEHFSIEISKQFELIGHLIFNLKNLTINQPLEIDYFLIKTCVEHFCLKN